MNVNLQCPILKTTLGSDGLHELRDVLDVTSHEWKEDVLEAASNRFERRLSEELGELRVEFTRELALTRVSLIRWVVGLSLTQVGITLSLLALMFHANGN